MIGSLSELLRATLQHDGHLVTLSDELALADRYLAIQQARFGDRLQIEIDVPEALRSTPVPRLILQPLLENAIHHGVGSRALGGKVRVTAEQRDSSVRLVVEDSAVGNSGALPAADTRGHGIGLTNTRARLEAMYGSRARVDIVPGNGAGTAVALTLPAAQP